ncbi:hypothetical protein C1I92_04360 [Jiangella anatolica]|uniref:Carbohydrate-binding domain-containing protein n=2 Tax=Jiangella anatolica TaxID=2670374 RepID=A0A2W2BEQ7_9ACTN|nr:hypothetical protein C1I92_04360 [Jiangella anatolica]
MIMIRRHLAIAVAMLLALVVLPGPATAADGVVAVEGEAAAATTFTPGVTANAALSGGKSLNLWAAVTTPPTDHTARYDVTVPESGLYQLDVASTPPSGVNWASPYDVKINDGAFEPAAGAVQYGQITTEVWRFHVRTVHLEAGANTITFRVNQARPSGGRYVMYLDSLALTPIDLQVASITADHAPLNVFEEGATAAFTVALNAAAPEATELSYTVQDYWSATVAQGTVPVPAGAESVAFDAGVLDIGHYSVTAQLTGAAPVTTNASVVLPDGERVKPADSPFAMDVAGAWRVPKEKWGAYARALDLSGVSWIRDRLGWFAVNTAPGAFDFTKTNTDGWVTALAGTDIKVLGDVSTAPEWTRQPGKQLPNQLDAAYEFARVSGDHFEGRIQAWEVLNEVNAGGWTATTETADQYAAVLKAAAIGYQDSGANPLVSVAGMAGRLPNPWVDLMLRNDVLDYADIYNYHLHQLYDADTQPTPLPVGVRPYLDVMAPYDPGDTAGWLTEAGLKFPGTSGRPMTAEEQRGLARYQVAWTVTSIAQGTDKHFVFLGAPYDEGTGQWGLFEPTTFTPYAGYTAEAAMTAALGEGRYVGRVPGLPAGVTGHVFGDGADSVLVLWADSAHTLTLDLDQSGGKLTNVVGESHAVTASAAGFTVDVGPDPVYLRVTGDVPVDTSEAPAPVPVPDEVTFGTADRVVLTQHYPAAVSANARENGYGLPIDAPTTMSLDVYNFNDAEVTGTITGTPQDGWAVADPVRTVTIPAQGKVTLQFQISATADVVLNKRSPMTFQGSFGGESTSRSTTLITTDQDEVTARHAFTTDGGEALRLAIQNPTDADLHPVLVRWTAGPKRGAVDLEGTIPAGETREFEIPLRGLGAGDHDYELRIRYRGGTERVLHGRIAVLDQASVTDFAEHSITVDGVPDDLTGLPSIDLVEDARVNVGTWEGPDDLSGDVTMTWDDENLYLSARITDDTHVQPFTGANTWQGDGFQFSLAPGLPGESGTWEEYDLALTGTSGQLYRRRGTGVPVGLVPAAQVAGRRDEATRTTVYELALPWTEIPTVRPSDGLMSLSLLLNENDGAGRTGYIEWGSGIGTTKDPAEFKPVRLLPAS